MTSNLNRVHNVHYEDRRFTDPSITSKNIVLRLEWAAGQRAFKNAFIQVSQGNRDGSGVIYGKIMQITSDADEVLVQLQDFAVQEDQNTFTLDYSSVGNISVTVFVQNIPEGNYAVVSGEGGVDVPIPEWENRPSGELHAWNFQFVDVIDNAGTLELDLLESDRRFYFERFGNIEGTDNIAIRKAHYFCGKSGTDQIVDTVDCGEQPSTAFQFFLNQNLGTAPLVIRRCQDLPSLPTDDAVVDYSPFGTEEFADYDFTESGSDGRKKLYEGDWVMFRCPSVFINATYTAHYIEKEPEEWKRVTICNIDGEWSSWYNEWEGNMACEPIGDYVWNFDAFGPCTDYDTHRNNVQYRDVWCAANIEGREELPVDPAFCTRPKPEITRACPYVVTAESETIR